MECYNFQLLAQYIFHDLIFLIFNSMILFFIIFFYFTILYWSCHTSTWIRHGCTSVPNPEPPSHLFHPSASSQCTSPKHPVSCIEPWLAISGMIWENGIHDLIFKKLEHFSKSGFHRLPFNLDLLVLYLYCQTESPRNLTTGGKKSWIHSPCGGPHDHLPVVATAVNEYISCCPIAPSATKPLWSMALLQRAFFLLHLQSIIGNLQLLVSHFGIQFKGLAWKIK